MTLATDEKIENVRELFSVWRGASWIQARVSDYISLPLKGCVVKT